MKTTFQDLKAFLDDHIEQSTDTNTIDVFSIPCGMGKSQYIKYKISDCLNDGTGLIVVTDSIDRLNNYVNDDDAGLTQFVQRNKSKISILTSDTITAELQTIGYKPVVLLTTQRYFQLTRDEIIALTVYNKGKRNRIIFDEKPYISELLRINIATVDKIDIALNQQLDNTVNPDDKQWLVTQWQDFIIRFKALIKEYEELNTHYQLSFWHDKSKLTYISDDDDRFHSLIEKYRQHLNAMDCTTVKHIQAIEQIIGNGARFISFKKCKATDNGEEINIYDNFFQVLIENHDKLINVNAKVFVLDGTADLMPDYDVYFINKIDCKQFKRVYPNLTIKCVDMPNVAKSKLSSKQGKEILKLIKSYTDSLPETPQCVFSFKGIEQELSAYYPEVNHFGNIKGFNKYNQLTNIMQIGVLRYPDDAYIDIAGYTALTQQSNIILKVFTQKGFEKLRHSIMCRYIAADIEQNLFRSKIRNIDCKESVTYTIMLNCKDQSDVISILADRFPRAKIEVIATPTIFLRAKNQQRKNKKMSVSQRVIDWLTSQEKNKTIKISDMLTALNLNYEDLKNAKKHNKAFQAILSEHQKSAKRGYLIT